VIDKDKTIVELQLTVAELVARVEALEKQLAKSQAGSVAPDFALSVTKLRTEGSETRPRYQLTPAAHRLNGVDEGMRIDAIEHGIRWKRATSINHTFGLPDDMPKPYAPRAGRLPIR